MSAVTSGPADATRRSALNAAKLDALVAARWGTGERGRHAFGGGAALTGTLDGEPTVWVLVDERPERSLGPALLWAERQGARRLQLVVDDARAAGVLARQAELFAPPRPGVWHVAGQELVAPEPAEAEVPPAAPVPPDLVDLLHDAGLELVVEDGIVRGELNGLEVARIAVGHSTAGEALDAPLLEVGVGRADRELTGMLHSGLAPVEQLDRVVDIVRGHRQAGAPPHPLNQLVPERWLRAVLCREPGLLGLASLHPAGGPHARTNLRDQDIALATGEDKDGEPVVVACAVGVALDLVPLGADARAAVAPGADLVLAVPERDDLAGNRRLAARLELPAAVAPVAGDWRR
jgi:hypothetical protein